MGDIRSGDFPLLQRSQSQEQEHGGTLVPCGWRVSLHCYVWDLTAEKSKTAIFTESRLEYGQRYWVGKVGGDYWVAVHKTKDGNVGLYVKRKPFPWMVSQRLLKFRVIRERPNMDFDAEDVVVWGDEDGY